MESYVEITQEHVGRALFKAFGRDWTTSGFIGRITSLDVGKRVFLRGGILQVENEEQRANRVTSASLQICWSGSRHYDRLVVFADRGGETITFSREKSHIAARANGGTLVGKSYQEDSYGIAEWATRVAKQALGVD